mmetsp:Transcript_38933/g.34609  ORF Transcript_38933/g.34609 Transcript_38933/m.34609 type:complete len:162 (+) Transcript_38933:517-1002(+)
MGNALKFTKEGHIKLKVWLNEEDPNYIEFAVEDTGIGMKPEDQAKLFQVFTKLDDWQDNKSGVGLGLCISNALARKLGKALTVESQYKKGSTFKFSILSKDISESSSVLYTPTNRSNCQKSHQNGNLAVNNANNGNNRRSRFFDEVLMKYSSRKSNSPREP